MLFIDGLNKTMINRQKDSFSCGAIALLNALEYYGIRGKLTVKDTKETLMDSNTLSKETGMCVNQLSAIMFHMGLEVERIDNVGVRKLNKALKLGHSVVLLFETDDLSHFSFIECRVGSGYRAWNFYKTKKPFISYKSMKNALDYSRKETDNGAWGIIVKGLR